MSEAPAVRVTDQFAHSSALSGALIGLAVGVAAGIFIVATGGVGAIAVGAAIGIAGGAGLAGQAIGQTIMGPPTGAIVTGSPNVLTNYLPQGATVIATGPCSQEGGTPQAVATGVATVLVNGMPAARKGEKMTCSAELISGSPDVIIAGDSVQVLPMEPEVPEWLSNTMMAMAIGGTIIATGGIAAAYGPVTAVGTFAGGMIGGEYGGMGASWLAAQMGFGETGQAIAGVAGGFLGGALLGGAGFKGGRWFDSRYQFQTQGLGSNFGNVRIVPRQPPTTPPRTSSKPEWLRRMEEGNDFNRQQSARYPHNEVYLDKPEGSAGYPRVDSYDPVAGEIVSRKHTQLGEVQQNTATGYLDEFANRYPPGSKIADVPSQRPGSGHQNAGLAGDELQGQMILEVPPQNQPVPQSVINRANELGITIRDSNGRTYN